DLYNYSCGEELRQVLFGGGDQILEAQIDAAKAELRERGIGLVPVEITERVTHALLPHLLTLLTATDALTPREAMQRVVSVAPVLAKMQAGAFFLKTTFLRGISERLTQLVERASPAAQTAAEKELLADILKVVGVCQEILAAADAPPDLAENP